MTPSEFIPHIEQTPLVKALTLAVAEDALRRVEEWEQVGHSLDVTVNVPYRLVDDPDLVGGIAALLDDSGVDPAR